MIVSTLKDIEIKTSKHGNNEKEEVARVEIPLEIASPLGLVENSQVEMKLHDNPLLLSVFTEWSKLVNSHDKYIYKLNFEMPDTLGSLASTANWLHECGISILTSQLGSYRPEESAEWAVKVEEKETNSMLMRKISNSKAAREEAKAAKVEAAEVAENAKTEIQKKDAEDLANKARKQTDEANENEASVAKEAEKDLENTLSVKKEKLLQYDKKNLLDSIHIKSCSAMPRDIAEGIISDSSKLIKDPIDNKLYFETSTRVFETIKKKLLGSPKKVILLLDTETNYFSIRILPPNSNIIKIKFIIPDDYGVIANLSKFLKEKNLDIKYAVSNILRHNTSGYWELYCDFRTSKEENMRKKRKILINEIRNIDVNGTYSNCLYKKRAPIVYEPSIYVHISDCLKGFIKKHFYLFLIGIFLISIGLSIFDTKVLQKNKLDFLNGLYLADMLIRALVYSTGILGLPKAIEHFWSWKHKIKKSKDL